MARKLMLTNTAIDAMVEGETLRDTMVPGLHVVRRNGKRRFFLYFRTKGGRERRPKMGDYGIISIADVRQNAREMLAVVAAGRDPMYERGTERKDPKLDDLWARVERDHYNRERRWDKEARRLYHAHVKPRLGNHRVRSIRYAEVVGVHTALAHDPIQANRTLAVISLMFNMAERYEWRPPGTNPCRSVPRYRELKRVRYAKPDELARLGPLFDAHRARNPSGVAFLRALFFSGARPSEIERATKDQLDRHPDGSAVIRVDEGKAGQRKVFLPAEAVAEIDALKVPGDSLLGRKMPRKLWELIRKEAGCSDLWARDSRRTFVVMGLSDGHSAGIMGELMGHRSASTTKIYSAVVEDVARQTTADVAGRIGAMLNAGTAPE